MWEDAVSRLIRKSEDLSEIIYEGGESLDRLFCLFHNLPGWRNGLSRDTLIFVDKGEHSIRGKIRESSDQYHIGSGIFFAFFFKHLRT